MNYPLEEGLEWSDIHYDEKNPNLMVQHAQQIEKTRFVNEKRAEEADLRNAIFSGKNDMKTSKEVMAHLDAKTQKAIHLEAKRMKRPLTHREILELNRKVQSELTEDDLLEQIDPIQPTFVPFPSPPSPQQLERDLNIKQYRIAKEEDKEMENVLLPCAICLNKPQLDAMNLGLLFDSMTIFGGILPRYETKYCSKHQRRIAKLIKKAKHFGFMRYRKGKFAIRPAVDPDVWMDWSLEKSELSASEVDRLFSSNKVIQDPINESVDTLIPPFSIKDVNLRDFQVHVEGLLKSVSKEELIFDHDSRLLNIGIDRSVSYPIEDKPEYFDGEVDQQRLQARIAPLPPGTEFDSEGRMIQNPEGNLPEHSPHSQPFSRAILAMGDQLRKQSEAIVREEYVPAGLHPDQADQLIKILHGVIDEALYSHEQIIANAILDPEDEIGELKLDENSANLEAEEGEKANQ